MKLLCINGVNLNLLGIREPEVYGNRSYKDLKKYIKNSARESGIKIKIKTTNSESEIVNSIQKAYKKYDGIIINAGAYTHTSVAILDALRGVNIKTAEVHLTDTDEREDYRKRSFISEYAEFTVKGKGFSGYSDAINFFKKG